MIHQYRKESPIQVINLPISKINLLTAIEKKFNIKFKLADVRNLKNVGDLLDLVARMVG